MNTHKTALVLLAPLIGFVNPFVTANAQETKTVVAGEQYGSPPGGRFFFGDDYRDLWTAPIRIEALDLSSFAGGLRPVMRVGGNSTKGLALKGVNGRDYTFRGVDKDLSGTVPVEFQDSVLVDIVQDQIAANVPGVQVVIPPLAQAARLLTIAEAKLVVMPDDPALGEFRQDFAGVLGIILEFPQPQSAANPGFHGATEILSPDQFWAGYQASPDVRPNTDELLRARLFDMFINDYDRHLGQWRWARFPGESRLRPIPEDPDMAFTDYEGAALGVARLMGAPYVVFSGDLPPLASITKNGWDQDRVLLTDIDKEAWMRIAADLRAKLTDAVIDDAVRLLPAEYYMLRGVELADSLKSRRDQLTPFAERFYHYMAKDVDVHGTDSAELVDAEWMPSGDLLVTLTRLSADGSPGEPFYRRRFTAGETDEVRIYLHGGNDRVVTRGRKTSGIKIRGIGGAGNDVVDDSAGSGIHFYDSEGANTVEGGNGTSLDSRGFAMPSRPSPNDVTWAPNQDWGQVTVPVLAVGYAGDPGVTLGGGIDIKTRGFRKYPWSTSHLIEGAWAFGAAKPRLNYVGAFRRQNSNLHFELNSRFSGIEQLRYYGLGNETEFDSSVHETYDISNYQTEIFPALVFGDSSGRRFAIGPYIQYSDSSGTRPDTVLGQEQPLGFGKFGYVGLRTEFGFSSRKGTDVFANGIEFQGHGEYSPGAWDAKKAFGSADSRLDAHLSTQDRVFYDLFVGGRKVWGDFPFFEAAYIENRTTTGYGWNRFAGDASLYGGASAHLILGKSRKVIPGDFGLTAFTEAGRVYLSGEDSSKWHPAYGVGVFYAPFRRSSLYGLNVGKSQDRWFIQFEARMRGFGL